MANLVFFGFDHPHIIVPHLRSELDLLAQIVEVVLVNGNLVPYLLPLQTKAKIGVHKFQVSQLQAAPFLAEQERKTERCAQFIIVPEEVTCTAIIGCRAQVEAVAEEVVANVEAGA